MEDFAGAFWVLVAGVSGIAGAVSRTGVVSLTLAAGAGVEASAVKQM